MNKQKKATNFVSSKKQVVTFEKKLRPPQPKKPNTKSRLFDYEKNHRSGANKVVTSGRASSSHGKTVSFADGSMDLQESGALSSTQAQYRHLKAMDDIKKKGQGRLK